MGWGGVGVGANWVDENLEIKWSKKRGGREALFVPSPLLENAIVLWRKKSRLRLTVMAAFFFFFRERGEKDDLNFLRGTLSARKAVTRISIIWEKSFFFSPEYPLSLFPCSSITGRSQCTIMPKLFFFLSPGFVKKKEREKIVHSPTQALASFFE